MKVVQLKILVIWKLKIKAIIDYQYADFYLPEFECHWINDGVIRTEIVVTKYEVLFVPQTRC